jgi:hypothetical protein
MRFGLSLGLGALGAQGPLNMAALFAAQPGREGTFYGFSWDEILAANARAVAAGRPQDCVAFEDSVGTVPLLAPLGVGKGCGLLLDREYGLARGPELVTNGTFYANVSGWSPQNANAPVWVAGQMSVTTTLGGGGEWQDVPVTAGRWYEVTSAWNLALAASLRVFDGSNFTTPLAQSPDIPGPVSRVGLFVRPTGSVIRVYLRSIGNGEQRFDNVSVRELPGNHAVQPTAAARGEMSRRVNALVATENLQDGAWVKASPTNTPSANTVSFPDVGRALVQAQTLPAAIGVRAVFSVELSGVPGQTIDIGIARQGTGTYEQTLSRVTLTSTPTRYSVEHTIVNSNQTGFIGLLSRADAGATATLVTADKADLRLAADAIPSLPPYQRVTSAADYDEAGFPAYLRRQTDDWMRTRINPNGATKVLALVALQKMSETPGGVVFEATESGASSPASIALFAPSGTPNTYLIRSRGTAQSDLTVLGFTAPARHVLRCYAQINPGLEDVLTLHVNGAVAGSSTVDQGGGSFAERDYFIGARISPGLTLPLNSREYSPPLLIFMQTADPGLSASQIARIEREMNKSIKAY